jgi:hypothetical protein
MKVLRYFERSEKLFLFVVSLLFFFLRFPSLFEPYWYGDEGIYFVIGEALREGRVLYSEIWDNKPPLLYILYQFFGQSIFQIKTLSFFFGLGAVFAFYFLSKKLLASALLSFIGTVLFAFFLGTPTIEGNIANAENFMILPLLGGFLLFLDSFPLGKSAPNRIAPNRLILIGTLFGISFLFKIVGIFDFAALIFFLFLLTARKKTTHLVQSSKAFIFQQKEVLFFLLLGFFAPVGIYSIVSLIQGNFLTFVESAFLNNVSYVELENTFVIPHGFLVLKTFYLLVSVIFLFSIRARLPKEFLFVVTWLVFSLYSVFFSQRPYGHYVLLLLPSFILFFLSAFSFPTFRKKIFLSTSIVLLLIVTTFHFFLAPKLLTYYTNFFSFISGGMSTSSYLSTFDYRTQRDYTISHFLKTIGALRNDIFIWGDSAQIYFMSDTLPVGRYTVSYHVGDKKKKDELSRMLLQRPPKYIVLLPDTLLFPFSLTHYTYHATVEGADIYERIE